MRRNLQSVGGEEASAPDTATSDARRRGRVVLLAGIGLGLAVLLAAYVHVALERSSQIRLWRDVAEADARSIAAQVHRLMQPTDVLARVVRDRLEGAAPDPRRLEAVAGSAGFHEYLRERKLLSPGTAMVTVAGADGIVVNFSHGYPPRARDGGPIDVSGSAFFRALRADASARTAVGHPGRNHVDGQWRFHVAHAVRAPDGALLAVVFAGVDLASISRGYEGLAMRGKTFRLFHEDGTFMLRWPAGREDQIGKDYSGSASMRVFRQGLASGVFGRGSHDHSDESPDGLRIVAPVAVGEFPLVVSVRLDESLVLASWRASATATGLLAALMALLIVGAGAAFRRHILLGAEAANRLARSEERLRRQEAEARKLALIAKRTDNAVVLTDAAGRTVWVNEGFTRITGYSPEDVVGCTPGSVLQGPQTDPSTRERIRARIAAGEGFKEEVLNYRRDGQPYWLAIEVQPMVRDDGVVDGFMAIERDVTAEHNAKRNLHLQIATSDLLVRASSLRDALPRLLRLLAEQGDWRVVQAWSRHGERLAWSASWASPGQGAPRFVEASRTLGLAKGEAAPGRAWALSSVEAQPDFGCDSTDPRSRAARDEGIVDGWCVPVFAEGELKGVLEFAGRRVRTSDPAIAGTLGAVGGMLGQFIARRAAERRLRDALTDAERATLAKTRFIATVSHEIRTPLNAVVGLASLMAQEPLEPGLRAKVDILSDAANQLLAVVNDVLDLSRLEAGRMAVTPARFVLRDLLDQVLRVTRALPGAGAIEIGCRVEEGVPAFLVGDAMRISQLLLNLLGNAVKFTPRGRVDLAVNARLDGVDRWVVTFAVRDTGIGIPPEFLQRVFEPFEQVPREDAPTRGSGLGLAICQRIAASMGGVLDVRSAVGEGTEFRFEVPLACDAGQEDAPGFTPAPAPPARLRVLLAEDTPASQLVARMILERLGHEVVAVNDGDDAVRVARERPFDVVFLDIQMPRMSGFAAARAIRELGEIGRGLRIVGLSAMAQQADREQAAAAGMDLYLTKPVRLEDVERALAAVTA